MNGGTLPRGALTLVDTRYQQNNTVARARLLKQIRYVGRATLYGRLAIAVDRDEATRLLAAHALAPDWRGRIAYHRLLLSLRSGSRLRDAAHLRVLTSVGLDELGLLLDRRLVWVAGIHTDTDNLHAHILLAGGDERGRPVEIRCGALAQFKQAVEARARTLAG